MKTQTLYQHWLLHLRALLERKLVNHDLPADDWKKMEKMGLVDVTPDGRIATALAAKAVQTYDAMQDLKHKGIKLSW